jgi:hypothetical protein
MDRELILAFVKLTLSDSIVLIANELTKASSKCNCAALRELIVRELMLAFAKPTLSAVIELTAIELISAESNTSSFVIIVLALRIPVAIVLISIELKCKRLRTS